MELRRDETILLMENGDFSGRVAVVTGAWRGLGRAAAARLHERGATVAVNVRDSERAEAVAKEIGECAFAVPGDIAAEIAYAPLTQLAMKQSKDPAFGLSTLGFVIQVFGRAVAWGMVGVAMGLGQGIALRSKRLLIYGLLGGVIGGLLGGMLFDPIDQILLGTDKPSAHWSRMVGITVIGATVGAMIGIVELLARDTWLRMTQGPLTGKEFILFKDVMNVGASPRSDIYLFNDPQVAGDHAVLRNVGDECEIEAREATHPVLLNNNGVRRARLRHGDTVTIGRTIFVFQRRRG